MSRYHLRTLGALSLHREGPDGEAVLRDAKALAVLAYLADTPEGSGDRAHLARLLWPLKEASRARAGLRQALYYLRRRTSDGPRLLRSDEHRLALDRRGLTADLWAFEEALDREDWERVLDLHEGPFLGDYSVEGAEEFRRWRDSRDDGIRAGVREACRALVSGGLEGDDPDAALRAARCWAEMNPLDERARSALIRALVATGDRAGAFRAYESYRTLLQEELGETPGPGLSRALEEIRSGASRPARREDGDAGPPAEDAGPSTDDAGPAADDSAPPPDATAPPDPAAAPTTPDSRSWIRRGSAAAVLALAVFLIVAAGWRVLAGGGDGEGDAGSAVEVLLKTGAGEDGIAVQTVRWLGDSAEVISGERLPTHGLPGPGGGWMALAVRTPGGLDLAVRGPDDGEPRRLTRRPADERPVAWSPDGRWIVYQVGRVEEDGGYTRRYRVRGLDGPDGGPEGGSDRSLGLPAVSPGRLRPPSADWSPLGTSVAVVSDSAGDPDVWTVAPDGSAARNLTAGHEGYDGEPAWSPEGRRIAFVSDRSGSRDVWVMGADGADPRRLTFSSREAGAPAWLAPRRLGYCRRGPERAEYRSVDVATGDDVRLAGMAGCEMRVAVRRPGTPGRWIASVELPEHLERVAPGQWIRREATVRDARGEAVPARELVLSWSASDSSVLDPTAGDGWLRIRGTGEATLRVEAAGWRADSARLRSRPPEVRELEPTLSEDWTGGLDTARWVPVGDPPPEVMGPEERFPAAFLNRGDENFHSGAVGRRALRTADGLTLEWWGRAPFSRPRFQALFSGLVRTVPPAGHGTWTASDAVLTISSGSAAPDSLVIRAGTYDHRIPAPDSPDVWHLFAVQVDTAGRVSVLVDGRMHWRSPGTVDPADLDGTHPAVYGRSHEARILHGPVRAWEGVRYAMP